MLNWEWYKNEHTKNVFLHCLLKAYWKDTKIEGKTIPRGSFVSSIGNIAEELALTPMEVRTALKHLKLTNEITSKGTNRNTVFAVTNYDLYQSTEQAEQQADNKQIINEQQTINKPLTTNEEYKEDNNIKNDKEEKVIISTVEPETKNRSDIQVVLESWNELERYGIKAVTKLKSSTKRCEMLSARIREYSIKDVLLAIENIKHSRFLQGKNNKGWTITFDWFVRPNNFPKVFEGNYVDSGGDRNGCIRENDAKNIKDPYAEELERLLNE